MIFLWSLFLVYFPVPARCASKDNHFPNFRLSNKKQRTAHRFIFSFQLISFMLVLYILLARKSVFCIGLLLFMVFEHPIAYSWVFWLCLCPYYEEFTCHLDWLVITLLFDLIADTLVSYRENFVIDLMSTVLLLSFKYQTLIYWSWFRPIVRPCPFYESFSSSVRLNISQGSACDQTSDH